MQSRSGELAMRPLPAVLLDLHEDLATGKLQLRRGRVAKTVDMVNGNPVSTASTPRDETLGHFLVSSGVLSEEQHHIAVQRAANLGGKLGEALVALQFLTVEQLIDQLGRQARHKLVQALRWPQGAWRFDDGTVAVEGMQLRMLDVVLGGLRETAQEDLQRLARLDGMAFELTERGKRLRHELRKLLGERPFAALSAGASITEIEKSHGDRVQARAAVDSLLLCDAIVTKTISVGLGARPERAPSINYEIIPPAAADDELYELLFDDEEDTAIQKTASGAAPLSFEELSAEDSGVVSTFELAEVNAQREQVASTRTAISAEHSRLQGADHYAALLVDRDAKPDDIGDSYQIKLAMFERLASTITDARDREKVTAIRNAYATAHAVLSDPRKRTAYDRELAGGELVQVAPALDTELTFKLAENSMAKREWTQAIGLLKTVISRSPNEADYHAALGWALWNAASPQARFEAGDAARGYLNQALTINPDHAASHDYKGRIDATLRIDDPGALFHLERAIDLEPSRTDAIAEIEHLLVARGELRRLERVIKRVLFRLRGKGGMPEASAWLRLAKVYLDHLDDPVAAAAAIANAKKLAPQHPELVALAGRAVPVRRDSQDPIRAGWRDALANPAAGAALVRTTVAAGHADAAFLAAATMVALGSADQQMTELYELHRVRELRLPVQPLTAAQWGLLRHREDSLELGALLELVTPAVHVLAPMTLADSDLDASQVIADADLPPAFRRARDRLSEIIGVATAPVYPRVELGAQIHVLASDPPVLLAGDEALTAPERPELVFRMARALTFLWPGRAVGASRPGRVLRAIVLAIVREAAGTDVGREDALAANADAAVAALGATAREQARSSALRLLSKSGGGLNLSLWAKSLARTADRAGMLLCGDIPAAFAGAREVGELERDMLEFAYSASHVTLRQQLGLNS
jgi:tetratricopeptide (TPR) repeat protein